ncbi:MAG TPA: hypothetical protein VKY90_16830 [Candidatus Dormibacteraeota bacterium]|nr:hypothetical protein [Candidatus Dormibacteraeota bacterium]
MLGQRDPQVTIFDGDQRSLGHVGERPFRDEDLTELSEAKLGRPSGPPSLPCLALLLQTYERCTAAERGFELSTVPVCNALGDSSAADGDHRCLAPRGGQLPESRRARCCLGRPPDMSFASAVWSRHSPSPPAR